MARSCITTTGPFLHGRSILDKTWFWRTEQQTTFWTYQTNLDSIKDTLDGRGESPICSTCTRVARRAPVHQGAALPSNAENNNPMGANNTMPTDTGNDAGVSPPSSDNDSNNADNNSNICHEDIYRNTNLILKNRTKPVGPRFGLIKIPHCFYDRFKPCLSNEFIWIVGVDMWQERVRFFVVVVLPLLVRLRVPWTKWLYESVLFGKQGC